MAGPLWAPAVSPLGLSWYCLGKGMGADPPTCSSRKLLPISGPQGPAVASSQGDPVPPGNALVILSPSVQLPHSPEEHLLLDRCGGRELRAADVGFKAKFSLPSPT